MDKSMTPNKLPPLPEPKEAWLPTHTMEYYTAEQMEEYASEALRQSQSLPAGAVADVLDEIERATRKFPTWPTDPLHAVAVLGEEFGELTKAVLQSVYEPHKANPDDDVRPEAVQTAAMALRFLMSLDRYEYTRGVQHEK